MGWINPDKINTGIANAFLGKSDSSNDDVEAVKKIIRDAQDAVLPAKKDELLGRFQKASAFKDRLISLEPSGEVDMIPISISEKKSFETLFRELAECLNPESETAKLILQQVNRCKVLLGISQKDISPG